LFKEAAEQKEPDAIFYLAYFKLKEASKQENEKEYQEANDMLRRVLAEDNEHSDALYYLGFLYENGLGTDRDLKTSLNYYQKAVKASGEQNAKAMYKLGNLLYSGEAGGVVNKGKPFVLKNFC
jgi:TPR repeat protein